MLNARGRNCDGCGRVVEAGTAESVPMDGCRVDLCHDCLAWCGQFFIHPGHCKLEAASPAEASMLIQFDRAVAARIRDSGVDSLFDRAVADRGRGVAAARRAGRSCAWCGAAAVTRGPLAAIWRKRNMLVCPACLLWALEWFLDRAPTEEFLARFRQRARGQRNPRNRERKRWWHWQDLREDRRRTSWFRNWPHGRAWFYFGSPHGPELEVEWALPSMLHLAASIEFGEERELKLHLSCGLFSIFLGFANTPLRPMLAWASGNKIELSWFRDTLFIVPWGNRHGDWSRRAPWWRNGVSWVPLDTFFGRTRYSKREIERRDVLIPLPEGSYAGRAVLHEDTWQRPRLPWASARILRCTIDMAEGQAIPHAGKGENSWDCGDDATWGLTTPASSIDAAVGKMTASVLETRRRYGEASWLRGRAPALAAAAPDPEGGTRNNAR